MSRRLILVLVLALVLGISFAAYAEVQNVKVSGDITALGVYRNNFDLTKSSASGAVINTTSFNDQREYLASIARLRVDADLTDNVSAVVRLINERAWNGNSSTGDTGNQNIDLGSPTNASYENESFVALDLAYVTAKEFLYSPLTLSVGRQELHFGNDWIVGAADTNGLSLRSRLPDGDLSMRNKPFDAIRATLDYNPLVVDIIYAKIAENQAALNDDTTLAGLNARYELDKNNTLEGFFFQKRRGSNATAAFTAENGLNSNFNDATTNKQKADQVNTVGARVMNKSVKNLTVDVSGAFQFGTYNPKLDPNANFNSATDKAETTPRRAWGVEALATYNLKDVKHIGKYDPSITAAYVGLSGNSREKTGKKAYTGWDAMYENQTFGHIINGVMGFSNVNLAGLSIKAKPMDDITLKLDSVGMWVMKRFTDNRLYNLSGVSGAQRFYMAKNPFMGQEYDLTLTYDYTEDVQFSLLGGIFLPGGAIKSAEPNNTGAAADSVSKGMKSAATELIGSMKVTF